ncbi:hypothetical protein [Alteribacillus iranensis]|uniref:Flagellar protein FliT n=1 Tax=Alteribacillus iranensis TaxID=930128 RepID=A0A1I2EIV9_9BACI|nr:hypothetical protein [Alteribacillus iranensis]SFE92902.1 flagellar protein FliT [Alteribacillus iranensis]
MALLKELYLVTKALHEHVSVPLADSLEERESYLSRMNALLEERATLLTKMKSGAQYSDAEMQLGRELVKMNEEIHQRMQGTKNEMRMDIQQLKKKKKSKRVYELPYEGPTVDGVFFDKKN